jgi:aspartate/methionine/tyrosine aminotransferase
MTPMKIAPSASMEITRIAKEMRRNGMEVFTLSIGDTHFSPPEAIQKRFATLPSEYSHYTDGDGIVELREIISTLYPDYQPADVVLVPGLKQGLFYLMSVLPISEVVLPEPAWLGYHSIVKLGGKKFTALNLKDEKWKETLSNLSFDAILVCHPNNPDGKLYTEDELKHIRFVAEQNQAWVITDEIYSAYVFQSGGSIEEVFKRYDRLIRCNGMSKSHAMTGFRIGYMLVKDEGIRKSISALNQNTITCAPAISQYLSLGYVEAMPEVAKFSEYYLENRSLVLEIFPEWEPFAPHGGFYFFVNLAIYGIEDAGTFCTACLKKAHVALVPGSAYGTGFDSWIRLSFSLDREQLRKALLALRQFILDYCA